jgi:hypothetical protein
VGVLINAVWQELQIALLSPTVQLGAAFPSVLFKGDRHAIERVCVARCLDSQSPSEFKCPNESKVTTARVIV